MSVVNRGIRNAFRNVIRSVSIIVIVALSIGLSLAMLLAHQAVGRKIMNVKASVGNSVTVSPAGVRGFEGGGNPLTQAEADKVKALNHVTAVSATLTDRLTSAQTNLQSALQAGALGQRFSRNNGQTFSPPAGVGNSGDNTGIDSFSFTPPITVIGTNTPTDLSATLGGGTFTLKSGTVFRAGSSANVAMVGANLATKNSLRAGSTFTAYGQTIAVSGIFDAGNKFSNNQLIMPLSTVQALSGQPGQFTSFTLSVDSVSNVAAVTSAAEQALGSSADVINDAQRAQDSITPLQNIQTISLYSLAGAVAAGAVIILLTMIMIVRERRREIGVLKAIGGSNLKVMGQFTIEALTLTSAGAIVGICLGVIAGNPITNLLVTNSSNASIGGTGFGGPGVRRAFGGFRENLTSIHAAVGWSIILYGLLAALVIAVVGSALASLFISKIRPAEVMRVE